MKVVYVGSSNSRYNELLQTETAFLALGWDKWDDFGYKTLLPCRFVVDKLEVEISNIRILVDGHSFTASRFDELVKSGWNGEFPPPQTNFISNPEDIDFYQIIAGKSDHSIAMEIAEKLRDASLLFNTANDESAFSLIESEGFKSSLQREGGSRKAFTDGWLLFDEFGEPTIGDFTINIPSDVHEQPFSIPFKFNSKVLPYEINVLIGPNGIGKSYSLQLLVEYWLKIGRGTDDAIAESNTEPFDHYPNISRLILVSYSPFEEFTLDLEHTNLRDKDAYKYFGFRRKRSIDGESDSIGISRNLPSRDSVESIFKCVSEDKKYGFVENWVNKFTTAKQVLMEAIDFDSLALVLKDGAVPSTFFDGFFWDEDANRHCLEQGDKKYFKLDELVISELIPEKIEENIVKSEGVIFLKDNQPVALSSGQRLFSYIVINVLGALKNNSFVVVDEPELFLHPNLEITFISLLKSVLKKFHSKAILATHSLSTVREVPANCVHVLKESEYGKEVLRPPFETFGGDMQRISSYVFGDKSVTKPFDNWINDKVAEYTNPEELIEDLDQEINEEMMMRILGATK